ncbi:MAG TPA: ABC transporter permease [Anaerolineaceae bacterium]|nr:ABC transporter permease [Anaerolineaceae bacterium]
MKILTLALKDLRQMLSDKNSALFLVAMPIVFTLFMGFAFGSGDNGEAEEQRISLAWVETKPVNELSQILFEQLQGTESFDISTMALEDAQQALQRGKVDGILVIPDDFDQKVAEDGSAQITLVADNSTTTGQSIYQLLRAPITQLMSSIEIGRMTADSVDDNTAFNPAASLALEKWASNDMDQIIKLEKAVGSQTESWYGDSPYNQASPGIIVQFAIIGLVTSGQVLVEERKTRTLQRLMTTAMRPWQIIAGHMLAMFAIVFLQTVLMIIFGQFVLKVDYLRVPFGTFLIALSLGLWVASMGLLISTIAKSDNQVVLYAMLAMFFFSALGGTWFPIEGAGGAFAAVAKLLPSSWAMIGLQNILIRGLELSSLWQPAAILLAYALGFFLLAVWRFRKMTV